MVFDIDGVHVYATETREQRKSEIGILACNGKLIDGIYDIGLRVSISRRDTREE